MNNTNACFVSYRHTGDADSHAFVSAFVRHLRKQLKWWLPDKPVFFDEDGLSVGDQFNEQLANQLCRSACMVMFFSPLHFDVSHPYCALEYKAMLTLETKRLSLTEAELRNRGLILPIVFRGLACLPAEISGSRNYVNFDHIVVESDFESRESQQIFLRIAEQIYMRYVDLSNAGVFRANDCDEFRFAERSDIEEWLAKVSQLRSFSMPGR